jgi:hypothetical protein
MRTSPDDKSPAAMNECIRAEISYLDSPTDYREFIQPSEFMPMVMLSESRQTNARLSVRALPLAFLAPIAIYAIIRLFVALLEML